MWFWSEGFDLYAFELNCQLSTVNYQLLWG